MVKKAILKTLAYADIFDYPLKEGEILKFLMADSSLPLKIDQELEKSSLVAKKGDFYFLRGGETIVPLRKKRRKQSQEKMKIAKKVMAWLKLIPAIKMIAVTGALAMENSDKEDDIDLLFVTTKNRLWLSRGLVVIFLRLTGFYRQPNQIKNKICPNMFLDEDHLSLPKKERDLFSAHEVCQLKPLWDKDKTYQQFIKKNLWVKQFLPNWKP
ncbi:MAG TPA: hypothetical protein VMY36_02755 [Patescibacteria group bacterium]|nr:hypothetical protein [Patescibacteria group bacterium]